MNDLLTVLLADPTFENDIAIVDECMTFFLAGTVTTATTVSNTLCYLIQQERLEKRLRNSLSSNFKSFSDSQTDLLEFEKDITLETLDLTADDYLKLCFNEALRHDPPFTFSSSGMMTEDVEISGFKIKKGEMII